MTGHEQTELLHRLATDRHVECGTEIERRPLGEALAEQALAWLEDGDEDTARWIAGIRAQIMAAAGKPGE